MAAIQVLELPQRGGELDSKGIRHYTRTFLVQTSTPSDNAIVAMTGVGINHYSSFPGDGFAVCKSIKPEQLDGQLTWWQVTLDYDSEPFESGSSGTEAGEQSQQTPPAARPPVVKFGQRQGTKTLTEDLDGNPVVAKNGLPFESGLEVAAAFPTIDITANYASALGVAGQTYFVDSVNSVEANIGGLAIPAKQGRCTVFEETSQYESGAFFWQRHVVIELSPDKPWNPVKVVNAGTHYRRSMIEPWAAILDGQGQPVSSPVPLDAAGQPLPFDGEINFCEFKAYREVPFTGII